MKSEERLAVLLKGSGLTVSAAESCTGGRISHLITSVSGSSNYYLGSVTSYAVSVKERVLEVPSDIIERHGVVSAEVASAMADGVRKLTGSTFSIATTGLAEGSDGHYPEGTVWIAASGPAGTKTRLYQCKGSRKTNISRFTTAALRFLIEYIELYLNNNKSISKT